MLHSNAFFSMAQDETWRELLYKLRRYPAQVPALLPSALSDVASSPVLSLKALRLNTNGIFNYESIKYLLI